MCRMCATHIYRRSHHWSKCLLICLVALLVVAPYWLADRLQHGSLHAHDSRKSLPNLLTASAQGVRPSGLQKVPDRDLAEFINVCISPRNERPRSRQLLKHPYFETIRREKGVCRLREEALAGTPHWLLLTKSSARLYRAINLKSLLSGARSYREVNLGQPHPGHCLAWTC